MTKLSGESQSFKINSIYNNSLTVGMHFAFTKQTYLKELKNEKGFHLNVVCTEPGLFQSCNGFVTYRSNRYCK